MSVMMDGAIAHRAAELNFVFSFYFVDDADASNFPKHWQQQQNGSEVSQADRDVWQLITSRQKCLATGVSHSVQLYRVRAAPLWSPLVLLYNS